MVSNLFALVFRRMVLQENDEERMRFHSLLIGKGQEIRSYADDMLLLPRLCTIQILAGDVKMRSSE